MPSQVLTHYGVSAVNQKTVETMIADAAQYPWVVEWICLGSGHRIKTGAQRQRLVDGKANAGGDGQSARTWVGGCPRRPPPAGLSRPAIRARYQRAPIGSWPKSHPKNTAVTAGQLSRSWVGFRHRQEPAHHLSQAFRLPLFACAYPRVDGVGCSAHQPPIRAQKSSAKLRPCSNVELLPSGRVWFYSVRSQRTL